MLSNTTKKRSARLTAALRSEGAEPFLMAASLLNSAAFQVRTRLRMLPGESVG